MAASDQQSTSPLPAQQTVSSSVPYKGSFPNVASINRQDGKQAAEQLDLACAQLRQVGAVSAAERIARIDAQVGKADFPILAILAIVGRLSAKKTVEASAGTLPTHGWTFGLTLTNEDSAANAFAASTKDLDLQTRKPKPATQTTLANCSSARADVRGLISL